MNPARKKTGVIIQARLDSSRLPGKVMKKIMGRPILSYIIDRLKESKLINKIIVASTDKKIDKPIIALAKRYKVSYFAGDEKDVLERYYQAAKKFKIDPIVRVTGDCPVIDPKVIDRLISYYFVKKYDYVTLPKNYPEGIDVEVFSFKVLENAFREAKKPSEREHVTPYIWNNPKIFKLGRIKSDFKEDFSYLHWSVDEKRDLKFIRRIYKKLYRKGKIFYMQDILDLLKKQPYLKKINAGLTGYEGYQKSLREDRILLKRG